MVKAKHKITGLIADVSEGNLAVNPNLVIATESDINEARVAKEIKVFGAQLTPTDTVAEKSTPDATWTKSQLIALAQHRKVDVDPGAMTKAELLAALSDNEGA